MAEDTLGKRIKQLRGERDWSQPELATRMGVKQGTISRWERGTNDPPTSRLRDLAELLEVDLYYLITGEEPAAREERADPGDTPAASHILGTAMVWAAWTNVCTQRLRQTFGNIQSAVEAMSKVLESVERDTETLRNLIKQDPRLAQAGALADAQWIEKMMDTAESSKPILDAVAGVAGVAGVEAEARKGVA